jgi:AbrB family looped-hinge helix DNA binding protein
MKEAAKAECCPPVSCCKVEALVSIDERGQMVLPKEAREKANIRAGDKLAVISWERDGQSCCLTLMKAEALTEMVKGILGPIVGDIFQESKGG